MIRRLRQRLQELGEGIQWEILGSIDREHQLYHVGSEPEARRRVDDHHWKVRIHHRHPHPESGEPVQGTGTFHALPWEDRAALDRKVQAALRQAMLIHQPPWDLTPPVAELPGVECLARDELEHPEQALDAAAQELLAVASRAPDVQASHFELTLRDREHVLASSTGNQLEGRSSLATLYGVMVAGEGLRRLDFKLEAHRRSLAQLELPSATADACRFARDSLQAERPCTGRRAVVLSHSALQYLLDPILAHADAGFHLAGLSRFRKDEPILPDEPQGDLLDLISDGLLPMGTATEPFGPTGLPAARYEIVKRGVLRTVLCSPELAPRLGLPVTGPPTNLVVAPGEAPMSELLEGGPVLHVVEFSSFMPDRVTGDMMGEIRLAYEHDAAGCRPVRGGAVSGNLFAAMARMTLSRETVFRGAYQGPAAFRFEELTVAGD